MKRTFDESQLDNFKVKHGNLWKEVLSVESKVPYLKISRLLSKARFAKEIEISGICKAVGKTKDELFPISGEL